MTETVSVLMHDDKVLDGCEIIARMNGKWDGYLHVREPNGLETVCRQVDGQWIQAGNPRNYVKWGDKWGPLASDNREALKQ